MSEDREFHPKLGRLKKSRERLPKLFVAQVLAAAACRPYRPELPDRIPSYSYSSVARPRRSGRVACRGATAVRQSCAPGDCIVRQGFRRAGAVRAHLSYLRREGVTRDGTIARMFDAVSDDADLRAFAERTSDDRHHFRFMVSPEDASEMEDLRTFTRDLVKQMERDLGTQLDWVALDRWNTDYPHTHLIVRGADERGGTLVMHRDYISNGIVNEPRNW